MESEFIHWLRERLPSHPELLLGPGDDAAVLRLATQADIVVTSDLLTDGIHFRLDQTAPAKVGRKALAVNLSDLAAMAARPVAAIVSVAIPREGADKLARDLFSGLIDLAAKYDVAIAGGDTNTWSGGLVINITALGQVTPRGPLRRSGTQPGDHILVTGQFGGSILGKHLEFEPRVNEALLLHERYELHAGIDVSDGLSLDLSRMAAESDCGAALSLDEIPIAPSASRLAMDEASDQAGETPAVQRSAGETPAVQRTALEHALHDGEDFELILAAAPDVASQIVADQPLGVSVTHIGKMIPQPGLWRVTKNGSLARLAAKGFEHR